MLKSPQHRALFIALGLFTLMVVLSYQPRPSASACETADKHWSLRMDLMADLSSMLPSHEVVQDTLGYYVAEFARQATDIPTTWRYDFCCEDDWLANHMGAFRSSVTADFAEADHRFAFFSALQRCDFFKVQEVHLLPGLSYGTVDLRLPIPGTDGEILALNDVAFNLRTAVAAVSFPS